jgi:hypothetical protein
VRGTAEKALREKLKGFGLAVIQIIALAIARRRMISLAEMSANTASPSLSECMKPVIEVRSFCAPLESRTL